MISAIISSSVVILIILILRKLFRGKVGNGFLYALWLIVAVRLILPAPEFLLERVVGIETPQINSSVSLMNMVERLNDTVSKSGEEISGEKVGAEKEKPLDNSNDLTAEKNISAIQKEGTEKEARKEKNLTAEKNVRTEERNISEIEIKNNAEDEDKKIEKLFRFDRLFFMRVIVSVWFFGCLLLLSAQVVCERRFRRALAESREEIKIHGQRVYMTKGISTPLLFRSRGLITDIYIPEHLMQEEMVVFHGILHENTHKKHGDIWWGYLRNLLVAVYWFHPLVWVAAICSKRDCEYACDSSVMRQMNQEERISYGNSLLSLVQIGGEGNLFCTATEMRLRKSEMEERIYMVKRGVRKSVMATVLAILVVLGVSIPVFTHAKTENVSKQQPEAQPEKQVNTEKEDALELTMEKLIECYYKNEFSKWTVNDISKYRNVSERQEDDPNVVSRDYVGKLSDQGADYRVTITFYDEKYNGGILDCVMLENKETEESRMIYTSDKSFAKYVVSPEEFLQHDKILDERISYTLPEKLLATKDSYSFGIVGRLFYEDKKDKHEIYGIMDSCLWSSAGGLIETNWVFYDQEIKTVTMSLANYLGNGRYAAKQNAVREFPGGKLQNIAGCENITSIQGLIFTKDIVENTPTWFDKRQAGKLTRKEMRDNLFDRKLWIVSVMDEKNRKKDNSVGYVFFFDAERYTKKQMIALAKSIHLK